MDMQHSIDNEVSAISQIEEATLIEDFHDRYVRTRAGLSKLELEIRLLRNHILQLERRAA